MNRSNDSSRTVAELRDELLGFTHPSAVRRIASAVRSADEVQALYALLSAGEEPLAYRAAWTLCHLAPTWDAVLRDRYDELVAAALDCPRDAGGCCSRFSTGNRSRSRCGSTFWISASMR